MGIYTNNERWERLLPECEVGYLTESYLQDKFPAQETSIRVNSQVIPNEEVAAAVYALEEGYSLYMNGLFIAENGNSTTKIEYVGAAPIVIEHRWDLFQKNEAAIELDFYLITDERKSQKLSKTNTLIGPSDLLFIEKGKLSLVAPPSSRSTVQLFTASEVVFALMNTLCVSKASKVLDTDQWNAITPLL